MSKITQRINKDVAGEIIKTIDTYLFDCDGVLWCDEAIIPGGPEMLHKLKQLGKRVFYVTNNSGKTRAQVVDRCRKMGYPADEESIVCTAYVCAMYLKRMNFTGKAYVVGNESMAAEFDALGIEYEGIGADGLPSHESGFEQLFRFGKEWKPDPQVTCVCVGFDPCLSYAKMMKAASYAKNKNILFLATDGDYILPTKRQDLALPGTGCMVDMVKIPARREPHMIGKPGTAMFDLLHETHGLEASTTMMFGDNLLTDITMAVNCDLKSTLVLTGVDNLQHVEANQQSEDPKIRHIVPDYYIESVTEFGKFIADL